MGGAAGLLVIMIIAYFILAKRMQKSEYRQIKRLQQGTKEKSFSSEVLFQKLYIMYVRVPFLKRYILKLRRRLEIINIDDEYSTRRDSAKILTKALALIIPIVIVTILLTKSNYLIMTILLIFELFMIDTLIDGSVDKKDSMLLKEQLDFFSEIRHAYHEFNMVEEAIYQVSQDDEMDVSRQGEKIYEILISDDPEMELEKYYDIAPNIFLKEFLIWRKKKSRTGSSWPVIFMTSRSRPRRRSRCSTNLSQGLPGERFLFLLSAGTMIRRNGWLSAEDC